MGCNTCGTGKPSGCKSNGGCSSGGCNRMNVHDWLANMPIAGHDDYFPIVEVSFKNGSRKEFFRNNTLHRFFKGDYVTVEASSGYDVGEVSLSGELVKLQLKKKGMNENSKEIKKIIRPSLEKEITLFKEMKAKEPEYLQKTRKIAIDLKLQMKLSEIEVQADGKRAVFYYSAEERVDFRELLKALSSEFNFKPDMRQIGLRQEAAKVGGLGICGRELCCSSWLHELKGVNTNAARYQNLTINQSKLSGQCGRLKCCLNYELDTYLDALKNFPDDADNLQTVKGNAHLVKKDIFQNIMWYAVPGSSKLFPIPVERAKEIRGMNKEGKKPEDLIESETITFAFERGRERSGGEGFVDLVGQVSSRALDRHDKKVKAEKKKAKGQGGPQPPQKGQITNATKPKADNSGDLFHPIQRAKPPQGLGAGSHAKQNNPPAKPQKGPGQTKGASPNQNPPKGNGQARKDPANPNVQKGPNPNKNQGPQHVGNGEKKPGPPPQNKGPKPQKGAPGPRPPRNNEPGDAPPKPEE